MQDAGPPARGRSRGRPGPVAAERARRARLDCLAASLFIFAAVAAAFASLALDRRLVGMRVLAGFEAFVLAPLWFALRRGGATAARVVLAALAAAAALTAAIARTPDDSGAGTAVAFAGALLAGAFLAVPRARGVREDVDPLDLDRRRERIPALRRYEDDAATERARLALALFASGVLCAAVALGAGDRFLVDWSAWPRTRLTLVDAIVESPMWACVAGTVVATPLWYAAWRMRGLSNGRVVGLALAAALLAVPRAAVGAKDSLLDVDGWWVFLVVSGAFFLAAFATAPAARHIDATDALADWRALRRHRKSFSAEPR